MEETSNQHRANAEEKGRGNLTMLVSARTGPFGNHTTLVDGSVESVVWRQAACQIQIRAFDVRKKGRGGGRRVVFAWPRKWWRKLGLTKVDVSGPICSSSSGCETSPPLTSVPELRHMKITGGARLTDIHPELVKYRFQVQIRCHGTGIWRRSLPHAPLLR